MKNCGDTNNFLSFLMGFRQLVLLGLLFALVALVFLSICSNLSSRTLPLFLYAKSRQYNMDNHGSLQLTDICFFHEYLLLFDSSFFLGSCSFINPQPTLSLLLFSSICYSLFLHSILGIITCWCFWSSLSSYFLYFSKAIVCFCVQLNSLGFFFV